MNNSIAQQIRRIRQSRDLSQDNMADELGITKGAYSKIERGLTAISVDRLAEISKVLKVEIVTFFSDNKNGQVLLNDPNPQYGFATKGELEELSTVINTLRMELAALKSAMKPAEPAQGAKKTGRKK